MEDDTNPFEGYRNAFIRLSFRDTADRDYISARLLCRHHLTEQFLWMALQAVEKYLKAILLFHDKSTLHINHRIVKALNDVKRIDALGFAITKKAEEFIQALDEYGPDRYFELPRSVAGDELFRLDSVVWQVRRFCDDFFYPHTESVFRKMDQARLHYVQGKKIQKNRSRFRLDRSGFIESVLDGEKRPELRQALIWKNIFFGRKNRNKVVFNRSCSWEQSAPYLYPEVCDWASDKVKLRKAALEDMRKAQRKGQ